jgi:hypothetical protein
VAGPTGNGPANLVFGTRTAAQSWAENARIDTSGNLGLGVTPSAWYTGLGLKALQIGSYALVNQTNGYSWLQRNAYTNSSNTQTYIESNYATRYQQGDGVHSWYNAPSGTAGNAITFTQAMTLDNSGNLGIGTSSPSTLVTMLGTTSKQAILKMQAASGGTGGFKRNTIQMRDDTGAAGYDIVQLGDGGNALTFDSVAGSTSTTRVTLDSSGNLFVASTVANVNANALALYSTTGTVYVNHLNGAASGTGYAYFNYNGSAIGSISQNGTTGVLYNITSDYRLKEFVAPVTGAGERIDALNPVEFDWKSDGSRARGFFAHEFQQVYANSVTGEKDAVDEEGNPVYQTMQASTAEVIADLVAEIKSLRVRLNALENK